MRTEVSIDAAAGDPGTGLAPRTSARRMLVAGLLAIAPLLGGCASELVVLLPQDGGQVGAVDVAGRARSVTLDAAYTGARTGGLTGVSAVAVPEDQVRAQFADSLSVMPPEPVSYVLYFEEGTTSVTAPSRPVLEAMLADVRGRSAVEVQVTGHTDRVGSVADNDVLARERAAMVRSLLLNQGFSADMVRAVGRGEREPLVPTEDEVREPRNRRVEVIVR